MLLNYINAGVRCLQAAFSKANYTRMTFAEPTLAKVLVLFANNKESLNSPSMTKYYRNTTRF